MMIYLRVKASLVSHTRQLKLECVNSMLRHQNSWLGLGIRVSIEIMRLCPHDKTKTAETKITKLGTPVSRYLAHQ